MSGPLHVSRLINGMLSSAPKSCFDGNQLTDDSLTHLGFAEFDLGNCHATEENLNISTIQEKKIFPPICKFATYPGDRSGATDSQR